jgi:alpha-L-rhamnosidase
MVVGRFAYGHQPRFLLQLEMELADGARQVIGTDDAWRSTSDGPIRSAGIYDGEVYDARKELPGWDAPGFNDRAWSAAQAFDLGAPQLVWQRNEPIRVVQELAPIALTQPKPGTFVFDLGQNLVGWCRLRVNGLAGRTITLRHAEMLNDDGTLYTANLRGAPQVDRFIPRADGEVVFEPHFTYHGFRYLELTGLAAPPSTNSVVGRVFCSSAPETGRLECSDPSLTQLLRNIRWTQRANLMSTPNDCPQRDERFGWMGDIQAFAQTAIFNMDLAAFFTKFAQDIRDDQAHDGRFPDFAPHPGDPNAQFSGAPAWADAGVIVPWRAYQNYADTRLLAEHFDAARRWVDYVQARNPGLIWATNRHNDYNDWLNGDWIRQKDWPAQGGSVPKEVFATAFFAHSADLVSRMARVLGREADARRYADLFDQIKAAFNRRFVQADGRIEGDTQAGYALALHFDLLSEPLRPSAASHLVAGLRRYQNHLSTGIQSTHRAMLELPRWHHGDLAWQLLTNRTFPSWLYMLDNGATTIWERWDGYVKGRGFQDAGMNSFNHWAFGAVGEWMWRHLLGLNPDEAKPGWKHFTVAPMPGGGVTWARGEYQSPRGRIASAWRSDTGGFTLNLTVPPNTTATVSLPANPADQILEGGRLWARAEGVSAVRQEAGRAIATVQSGRYEFVVKPGQAGGR